MLRIKEAPFILDTYCPLRNQLITDSPSENSGQNWGEVQIMLELSKRYYLDY